MRLTGCERCCYVLADYLLQICFALPESSPPIREAAIVSLNRRLFMSLSQWQKRISQFAPRILVLVSAALCFAYPSLPQAAPTSAVLLQNVRLFNGTDKLAIPTNVLVVGGKIAKISTGPIAAPNGSTLITIDGAGRTLISASSTWPPARLLVTCSCAATLVCATSAVHRSVLRRRLTSIW